MTDPNKSSKNAWPARIICALAGLGLIAWALVDDTRIGGGLGFGLFQAIVVAFGAITAAAAFLPRSWVYGYLLSFVTIVGSLAVTETAAHYLLRHNFFTAFELDERLLFRLRPGASRSFTHLPVNGGETIVYHVNEDGFVGPELLPKGQQRRVVVYGDSFIHAEFSRLEDRFTTQLGTELETRFGEPVEVVNAGIAGYGPDQVLRRLEQELPELEPDLVVVSIFSGNDFGDLLRNRLYRLDETGALKDNGLTLSPEQERQIALNEDEFVLRRLFGNVMRGLRGSGSSDQAFDPEGWIEEALELHLAEYKEFVVDGVDTAGNFARDPYSADIAYDASAPSSQYKIAMMKEIVAHISAITRQSNTPALIMIVPHPMDLLDGDHSSGFVDRTKHPGYDPEVLTSLLAEMAEKHDLPHLNLYPVFRGKDVPALFFDGGDDHWNTAGQGEAAKAVAAFIEESVFMQP